MNDMASLGPGDPVEVFVRFNRSWVSGFEIAGIAVGGFQVRRITDQSLLPNVTSAADLRHVTKAFTWPRHRGS